MLNNDIPAEFTEECMQAFMTFKEKLISTPIIAKLDWSLLFKVVCNASNYAIKTVLGQRKNKQLYVIYDASRMLNEA